MNSNKAVWHKRDRRIFLKAGAAVATASLLPTERADAEIARDVNSANDEISVGIMGVNGRGTALAKGFLAASGVTVGYVCDVDSRAAERCGALVEKRQQRAPNVVTDFRKILDDSSVDALVIATPNHWHAPATIAGCQAGKHVYVEKPCSHHPGEGEWAVQAARQNDRVVQMGTQRRSWPAIQNAVKQLHRGVIGNVLYARTWYNNRRGPIGAGKQAAVPEWLDWDLWQGPAPRVPFQDGVVHYNWHWHWQWGNGELGNNGVHGIDVARWGLDVTYPKRVMAGGGKYRHRDGQQTPDTMMVCIDFPGDKSITWEGLSWSPLGPHDSRFGISFHGTEGSLVVRGAGFTRFDMKDNEVESVDGHGGDANHLDDFLGAIRESRSPNADIEIAHQSTLLCHLGNMAFRKERVLKTDPSNGHVLNLPDAESEWQREYEPGWAPKV